MIEPRKLFGGLGNRLFQMAYIISNAPDLYVQDEKYFENDKGQIKAMFRQGIKPSDYVSLHIRRGDYTDNPFYVDLCKTDYYDRAIAMFPGEKFLIFCKDGRSSDELDKEWCIQWAKEKGIAFEFASGEDEIDDFNLMAGCKAHICANSTFSWWASYVGGGLTIAPNEYYTDGVQRTVWPKEFTII